MLLTRIARKLQGLDRLIPIAMRLPLRFRVQSMLGELEAEVALLPELLAGAQGRVALDIGANLGIYAYALYGMGMKVHAFEPQPACCAVINAWAEGKPSVTVHNTGVGADRGELILNIPVVAGVPVPTRASFQEFEDESIRLHVPVVALDSIAIADIAFIKIDVEGFELQVLQGALGLLARSHPVLLVEIDRERHDQESFGVIIRLLSGLGYRSYVYEKGKLTDCSSSPWSVPAHHYNFIFIAGSNSSP